MKNTEHNSFESAKNEEIKQILVDRVEEFVLTLGNELDIQETEALINELEEAFREHNLLESTKTEKIKQILINRVEEFALTLENELDIQETEALINELEEAFQVEKDAQTPSANWIECGLSTNWIKCVYKIRDNMLAAEQPPNTALLHKTLKNLENLERWYQDYYSADTFGDLTNHVLSMLLANSEEWNGTYSTTVLHLLKKHPWPLKVIFNT